jgi:hypothetical protein
MLLLLLATVPQGQTSSQDSSGLQIVDLSAKILKRDDSWHPSMVSSKPPQLHPELGRGTADASDTPTAADLKTKQEDRDRRRQELDRVSEKRDEVPDRSVFVYSFRTQMKNTTAKAIMSFVWAYHLPDVAGSAGTDVQYFCNVKIAPGETKPVKVISTIPRRRVINVSVAGTAPSPHQPSREDMIINQIRFSDSDVWQRSDWNRIILTQQGARALGKSKCIQL